MLDKQQILKDNRIERESFLDRNCWVVHDEDFGAIRIRNRDIIF